MNNNLSLKEEKLFNFLLSKIVSLETELKTQSLLTQYVFLFLSNEDIEQLDALRKAAEKQRETFRKQASRFLAAELQALSTDFDNLITDWLN